jgi:hypothetical protein
MFSLSELQHANTLIKDSLILNTEKLYPRKDKTEPICCIRCHNWGHITCMCKATNDVCRTCTNTHCTDECNNHKHVFCVNCKSGSYPSYSRVYPPWREFTTVVLHKPGKPDYMLPKVYQPIALMNTTYKLLSSVIANHLSDILEKHELIPPTHFGSHPGRSTTDSLHLLEATIKHAWPSHQVVLVLFLDIEGTFPNTVNDRLIHNMCSQRIPENIVSFTRLALANRQTKLKFNSYLSNNWIPINNGIGQGDPLSMVLYIIYNADLLEICSGRKKTERA